MTSEPIPPKREAIVLEMQMVPVADTDGEFILEYNNGVRELLRRDGTRIPLQEVP